jgi:uracil-DNA glycosylase
VKPAIAKPRSTNTTLQRLLREVRACTICTAHLPQPPRPVLQAGATARILIAGQAPGRKVAASGVPFDDASGARLRAWMGIDKAAFYDPDFIAILPMGFCYPGAGARRPAAVPNAPHGESSSGLDPADAGDRKYAQAWHLGPERAGANLTTTVAARARMGRGCCPCRTRARATTDGSSEIPGSRRTCCPS